MKQQCWRVQIYSSGKVYRMQELWKLTRIFNERIRTAIVFPTADASFLTEPFEALLLHYFMCTIIPPVGKSSCLIGVCIPCPVARVLQAVSHLGIYSHQASLFSVCLPQCLLITF